MAPLFARGSDDRTPRRRWTDRIIGIVVGIVLGLGVLVYFVFVHSEGTIDAPKVNESGTTTTGARKGGTSESTGVPTHSGSPEEAATGEGRESAGGGQAGGKGPTEAAKQPVPVVKVIGGAPPIGTGPKKLTFHKGEKVRFEIETDEPFAFEIRGLGIAQSIEQNSIVSFKATKTGQFPVIASATLIGVADLMIKGAR